MTRKFEKVWTHRGLSCRVWMHPWLGFRCGYVDVPEGHPLHGLGYDSPAVCGLDVHGGVTFSQMEDGAWRIGFDCGHQGDLILAMLRSPIPLISGRFWSLEGVVEETERLADQVADMGSGGER